MSRHSRMPASGGARRSPTFSAIIVPWLKPTSTVRDGPIPSAATSSSQASRSRNERAAEARAIASGVPSSQGIGNH